MERVRDREGKDYRQGIIMMAILILYELESKSESKRVRETYTSSTHQYSPTTLSTRKVIPLLLKPIHLSFSPYHT